MTDNLISPRDPRFEALFERWNLTWEFIPELSLTQDLRVLDEAQVRDLDNIAAPARVDEYALQMKGGAVFPPLVLMSPNVLIDGNTRARAGRKIGRSHLPAYRVQLPDMAFARSLAAALNQMGGARLTQHEAMKAASSMTQMGMPDEAVARELGYSAESVRRWRREEDFRDRVEALQLGAWAGRLSAKQRQDIGRIAHDEPFAETVKLVADTPTPDPKEVKELVQTVERAPSDEQAIDAIRSAREDWIPIGPPPGRVHRNKAVQQFKMQIGGLLKVVSNPMEMYEPASADIVLAKIAELEERLAEVKAIYQQGALESAA